MPQKRSAPRRPQIIFVLVDGLGIGPSDPAVNPVLSGACPRLAGLIARHAVAINASLDMPGLPQSATGQTALLTGINAAKIVGRHVEGFPGPRLREIIRRHNIHRRVQALGLRATFANAYFVTQGEEVFKQRIQSVTTVAALQAFGGVRDAARMDRNEAVYQDLTRESLRERGYAGPLVAPEEAGRHLAAIAANHDFTLFEYFQTDRAGHKGDGQAVRRVLSLLDRFLGALLAEARKRRYLFILTSDHGNIEDARTQSHTANPVPFIAVGPGATRLRRRVRSILDVTPAILWILESGGSPPRNRTGHG